jgi:hypothetical protein
VLGEATITSKLAKFGCESDGCLAKSIVDGSACKALIRLFDS